jgi:transposase
VTSDKNNVARADDERKAQRLFARYAFPNRQRFCPRCRSRRLYLLRDGRRRCAKCRYTFNEFAGRWLSQMNFSFHQWLRFLELFAAAQSTLQIAKALNISYATAGRALLITRKAILSQHAAHILSVKPSYAVWGISQHHDRVAVKHLPNLDPDKALYLPVSKSIRAGVIYTNPWQEAEDHFQTLVFRPKRHVLGLTDIHLSRRPLAIDHLNHFWQYARTHRLLWRQIGSTHVGLYWGEQAFRFHHRNAPLLHPLIHALAALIPPA